MRYDNLLKDPRWQRRRLEIMQRDDFTCNHCGSTKNTLNVHHLYYVKNKMPWEYPDDALITLCEECHEQTHDTRKGDNVVKSANGKIILFRSLLKETRLSADEKIILSHMLTHMDVNNTLISKTFNISRKTVVTAKKKIENFNSLKFEEIVRRGYFELYHTDILKGELLIFYSYLADKARQYGGLIDTYKDRIANDLGKTKVSVTKLLNRLYKLGLAERREDGSLFINV